NLPLDSGDPLLDLFESCVCHNSAAYTCYTPHVNNHPERYMRLWLPWWNALCLLRPAFSRWRTFLWFATAVAGFTVRTDLLGVTSIVRALKLNARCYNRLREYFHSAAVQLDHLTALWTRAVLQLFPAPVRINGRHVLAGDGLKNPKRGRKMPAVKLL